MEEILKGVCLQVFLVSSDNGLGVALGRALGEAFTVRCQSPSNIEGVKEVLGRSPRNETRFARSQFSIPRQRESNSTSPAGHSLVRTKNIAKLCVPFASLESRSKRLASWSCRLTRFIAP